MIAHAFEPPDELLLYHLSISFVEGIPSQILINTAIAQEMRDDDQHAVSHRHCRFLCASSSSNATILDRKRGVFAVRSSVSGLNQKLAGRGMAFAGLAGKPFACTFLMAWADPNERHARCLAEGKCSLLTPISASNPSAIR